MNTLRPWPPAARMAGLIFTTAVCTALPALAADPATDAMLAAYVPYRAALFRTNRASQAESERAVADAQVAWKAVQQRFAAAPPVPYAADTAFAATLQQVGAVYAEADRLVRAGQLPQAHEVLEQVRDLLAELRQRNGVVVFSDAMNDYHAEMEHVLKDGPTVLQQPQGWMQLMARAGTLDYLAARLLQQAGAPLKANAEFIQGQRAVADSVLALRAALVAQDSAAAQKALSGLKGPYSRLFLKFG